MEGPVKTKALSHFDLVGDRTYKTWKLLRDIFEILETSHADLHAFLYFTNHRFYSLPLCSQISNHTLIFLIQEREVRLTPASTLFEKRRVAKAHLQPFPMYRDISRHNLVEDFLKIHTAYSELWQHDVKYRFLGEDGVDMGGVSKDAMATYWHKIKEVFLYSIKPTLAPDQCPRNCKCEYFSKIFAHSFLLTGLVPRYLHQLFVFRIFCSPSEITPEFRHKCIQLFIDLFHDSEYVQKVLSSGSVSDEDKEWVKEFFKDFEVDLPPDFMTNFAPCVENLVVERLFRNPPHFVRLCREKLTKYLGALTPSDAEEVWESSRPTGAMVVKILTCSELLESGSREELAWQNLKRWLLDPENASEIPRFLQWATGSSSLTEPYIAVDFNRTYKLPFVETCLNKVTFPLRYTSYDDFVGMMIETFETKESQVFSYY